MQNNQIEKDKTYQDSRQPNQESWRNRRAEQISNK